MEIGEEWFIFSDRGHCSLVVADGIKKAIVNWKKSPLGKKCEIVAVVKAAAPVTIENARMQSTRVYGVICCLQEKNAS